MLSTALWIVLIMGALNTPSDAAEGSRPMKYQTSDPRILNRLTEEELDHGRPQKLSPPISTSTFLLNRTVKAEERIIAKLRHMKTSLQSVLCIIEKYLESWDVAVGKNANEDLTLGDCIEGDEQLNDDNYSNDHHQHTYDEHMSAKEKEEEEVNMAKNVTNVYRVDIDEVNAGHPIEAYSITQHISSAWEPLQRSLAQLQKLNTDAEWVNKQRDESGEVTQSDFQEIAAGVGRTYDFYKFNLSEITTNINIYDNDDSSTKMRYALTAWDLYNIGAASARSSIFNSAVDFLSAAVLHWDNRPQLNNLLGRQRYYDHFNVHNITGQLNKVIKLHNEVLKRKGDRSLHHSTHRTPVEEDSHQKNMMKKKHNKSEGRPILPMWNSSRKHIMRTYHYLCRGTDMRDIMTRSNLYCRYVSNRSPLYIIGPLKMEVVSLNPYVVTIEDVVLPLEVRSIKNTSANFLIKSTTIRTNGGSAQSNFRTSSTAWLHDHNNEILPILANRVSHMTGLNTKWPFGAEAFQVINYGVGGHYTVHHDLAAATYIDKRFATFLIYLTDVPMGGMTVFPLIGTGVRAKQGRALLWYNVLPSGIADRRMEHGACPVIVGDKWIMNKWVLYGGQITKAPCDIDPSVIFTRPTM